MYFTVGQKRHKVCDVTVATRDSCLLLGKNDLKALLALGIKHLWISFEPFGRFSYFNSEVVDHFGLTCKVK
jgi:hypothetical protein